MRIRLHGSPEEMPATLAALANALEIRDVSQPYPDRPPSSLQRVYVDAVPRHQPKDRP